MSIMVCKNCENYIDTDFRPMSDEGICASCEDALQDAASLHEIWVSIRSGQIVGTPFGPNVPDGKYRHFAALASEAKAPRKTIPHADADTLLRAALQRLNIAAAEAILAGGDTTAHPMLNRQKLRKILQMADEILQNPNVAE